MHQRLGFAIALLAALGATMAMIRAQPAVLPVCNEGQMLGAVPSSTEVVSHRQFTLPVVRYAYGQFTPRFFPLEVTVRVDERGKVACYLPAVLEGERRSVLSDLSRWQYTPFLQDGKPVAAIVREFIGEEESPQQHRTPPQVPLNRVRITLSRTTCFGTCPSYEVTVGGDGRVRYTGREFVDVLGTHTYRVEPADVAKLVDSLRAKDLWSLRDAYVAQVTDLPTYRLTLVLGDEKRTITDYGGDSIGMPAAVSDFEDEVDAVARTNRWTRLSKEALDRLRAEGLDPSSQAGADLFLRAVANSHTRDEDAMVELLERGAPYANARLPARGLQPPSALEGAARNGRARVVDALIARSALTRDGQPDPQRINAAFRAAIEGGRLAIVRRIWDAAGEAHRPAMTYADQSGSPPRTSQQSPVSLLLRKLRVSDSDDAWDGAAIAFWLAERGCDLKASGADGHTLLHIAAAAGDVGFVRGLLARGFDPSTPGRYNLPAISNTHDEGVALVLLEAGTDLSVLKKDSTFYDFAVGNHWKRVVDWLNAHGMTPPRKP